MKRIALNFFGILFCFMSFGCDRLCKKNVEDVANVQNFTNRPLSLFVCKGQTYGEVSIFVPANSDTNEVSLGTRETSEVRGGPTATCSDVNSEKAILRISLSEKSFGQVKLCYDEFTGKNAVVEVSQNCPSGYLEQTSTGPCTK